MSHLPLPPLVKGGRGDLSFRFISDNIRPISVKNKADAILLPLEKGGVEGFGKAHYLKS
jgi:hypothetical protein